MRISRNPIAAKSPQSVQRVFGILEFLARSQNGETLSSIAYYLGAPKNSVVSLLAGMLSNDILTRDERAVYRLGPGMLSLSIRIAGGMKLPGLVRPSLERLRESTGETALAGILAPDADVLTYIDKVESSNFMRYTVPVGERRELYCTAVGKLVLAFMKPDQLKQYLRLVKLERLTEATITNSRTLKAALRVIRETGVASTRDERILGASGIAAAVVNREGTFIVGLAIVGPSGRIQPRVADHTDALVREAKEVSRLIADLDTAFTLRN